MGAGGGEEVATEAETFALLILRVWLGGMIIAHGVNHLRNRDGTARWFAARGWRAPRYQAFLSGAGEAAAGACLVLGFVTAAAAAGVAALMFTAYLTHHRRHGFFIFNRGEGYEYVATVAVAALALAALGPGEWSVDASLTAMEVPVGWAGVWFVIAGAALAVVHIAVFWRRPAE